MGPLELSLIARAMNGKNGACSARATTDPASTSHVVGESAGSAPASDPVVRVGAGVVAAGGPVSRASTTRRSAALYFGVHVVNVSCGEVVGSSTATSSGDTTNERVTRYVNVPWSVVTETTSPGPSSPSPLKGAPCVVRWPATAALPDWPGRAVPG